MDGALPGWIAPACALVSLAHRDGLAHELRSGDAVPGGVLLDLGPMLLAESDRDLSRGHPAEPLPPRRGFLPQQAEAILA